MSLICLVLGTVAVVAGLYFGPMLLVVLGATSIAVGLRCMP